MNLLFDLDGTIIDPGDGIIKSYCCALKEIGYENKITDDMSWVVGPPLRVSFAQILPSELIETAVDTYRDFHKKFGLNEATLYDGMDKVIKKLHDQGHDLYLCTAKNIPFAKANMEYFGLTPYFKEIYGAHLDGKYDNKSDLVDFIIKKHNLKLSDTYMIGDREYDMIAANSNGITAIGVAWGYGKKDELLTAKAKFIVNNTKNLLQYFSL